MDAVFSEVLRRVVEVYRRALANAPPAREWLAVRGVADAALLERCSVGWAEGTLAGMARGEVAARLRTLGLVDAEGRERFAGCVAIPVFGERGDVVQMAGYAADGAVTWLFPEETPAFWNGEALAGAREILIAADPLAGLVQVAGGRMGTVALGGPGKPLGQGAKNQLLGSAPKVTLAGCEFLRGELETLGIAVQDGKPKGEGGIERGENGFAVEFARRLRFQIEGVHQDSPRHLRASVKAFRRPVEDADHQTAPPPRVHLDTFDLYHARSRIGFAKTAACLLGEDPALMEDYLSRVVALAEEYLRSRTDAPPAAVVSEAEREEALALLRDPRYPECVAGDLGQLGYVGEEENKLVAYLASVSRKLDEPLSVLVVSRSAAGKSTLSEAIAGLAPPEDVLRFTRLTAQTLYYQKPDSLRHRMVVIEEERGVEDAAYALRILQSARKLSLSSASGQGEARTREVRGPVSLFVTTTRTDLDEETAGRFVTLSVDESREQTRAILAAQREAEARSPAERERLLRVHQNAQRLLAPLKVVNPYAPKLSFPDDRLSARRDHRKYLGLIRAVAFARQHQRAPMEDGAVQVTLEDIALANRLAHQALGQSIYDLTPPSRRLLVELREWLGDRGRKEGHEPDQVRFTQRELREHVGWKKSQLAEHLKELLEAEYLIPISGGSQGRKTTYRLDWDGQGMNGERFYSGLVNVAKLSGCFPAAFREASGKRKTRRKGPPEPENGEIARTSRLSGERRP